MRREHQGRRNIPSSLTLLATPSSWDPVGTPSSPWQELCPGGTQGGSCLQSPLPLPAPALVAYHCWRSSPCAFPHSFPAWLGLPFLVPWTVQGPSPLATAGLQFTLLVCHHGQAQAVEVGDGAVFRVKTGAENGPGASGSMAALSLPLTVDSSLSNWPLRLVTWNIFWEQTNLFSLDWALIHCIVLMCHFGNL